MQIFKQASNWQAGNWMSYNLFVLYVAVFKIIAMVMSLYSIKRQGATLDRCDVNYSPDQNIVKL
jgi:hypothetical protein